MRHLVRKVSRACGAAVVLMATATGSLCAQSVRGTVYTQQRTTVVPGVIVVFADAAGNVAGRALSDERGTYALVLAAGQYQVRALRVGFQPTTLPPVTVQPAGVTTVDVEISVVPVRLPLVSVRSEDVCRGQRRDGDAVAAVWEEARKALLASELSSDNAPLFAEWIEYERSLDAESRQVRSQRVRSTRTATTHAFRSASWNVLAQSGYVVDTDDGTEYHAPDAEVLLSDSFAALHCFHLEPPRADRPHVIGVGFSPARERRNVSEIEGTFWIDQTTGELQLLEFQYTNLPPVVSRVAPGGMVRFLRLGTGSWLVSQWHIRMPQLAQVAQSTVRRRGVTVTSSPVAVAAVRVVGGEVERVRRADSVVYEATGAAFTVALQHEAGGGATSGTPSVHQARVVLEGTDYTALSDSAGRIVITPVLPGRYRYRVQTPLMDSLGVAGESGNVDIAANDRRVTTVTLPSPATLLRQICQVTNADARLAHVRGEVVDMFGTPVADAHVTVTWQQSIDVIGDRMSWSDHTLQTQTDSSGRWHVCGVPRGTGVMVSADAASAHGKQALRVAAGTLFASSSLRLQPAGMAVADTKAATARVIIVVTDSARHAVRDARITIASDNRGTTQWRTDGTGRVVLPRVDVGSITVDVRKVGYASGILTVDVEPGENTVPVELLSAAVPQLAAVRVVGNREVNTRHSAFERRRERGDATHSITAEDIERRNPVETWQLLTRVPSVVVVDSSGERFAKSARMSDDVCWLQIAVDGRIRPGRQNLLTLPPPSEIHGMEIFAGAARLPVEYHGGGGDLRYCGLIAIWTK